MNGSTWWVRPERPYFVDIRIVNNLRCATAPEAVAKMRGAGVGAQIELDLGGRTDMPSIGEAGRPLRVSGTVRVLIDGRWTVRGPMYTGMRVDMGSASGACS